MQANHAQLSPVPASNGRNSIAIRTDGISVYYSRYDIAKFLDLSSADYMKFSEVATEGYNLMPTMIKALSDVTPNITLLSSGLSLVQIEAEKILLTWKLEQHKEKAIAGGAIVVSDIGEIKSSSVHMLVYIDSKYNIYYGRMRAMAILPSFAVSSAKLISAWYVNMTIEVLSREEFHSIAAEANVDVLRDVISFIFDETNKLIEAEKERNLLADIKNLTMNLKTLVVTDVPDVAKDVVKTMIIGDVNMMSHSIPLLMRIDKSDKSTIYYGFAALAKYLFTFTEAMEFTSLCNENKDLFINAVCGQLSVLLLPREHLSKFLKDQMHIICSLEYRTDRVINDYNQRNELAESVAELKQQIVNLTDDLAKLKEPKVEFVVKSESKSETKSADTPNGSFKYIGLITLPCAADNIALYLSAEDIIYCNSDNVYNVVMVSPRWQDHRDKYERIGVSSIIPFSVVCTMFGDLFSQESLDILMTKVCKCRANYD